MEWQATLYPNKELTANKNQNKAFLIEFLLFDLGLSYNFYIGNKGRRNIGGIE